MTIIHYNLTSTSYAEAWRRSATVPGWMNFLLALQEKVFSYSSLFTYIFHVYLNCFLFFTADMLELFCDKVHSKQTNLYQINI